MNGNQYRMSELLDPADGHSLVVDTSKGLVLGALPGLEHFSEAIHPLLHLMDGIVASPGQACHLGARTRRDAALLVRADWTNALRGTDFVLPPETIQSIPLLDPAGALDLGASAMVMHFILGHEEDIEAQCMKRVVNWALEGLTIGMPLLVEVLPIGPRVVLLNKAIELGVSYSLEGGANGFVVPWPGTQSFKTIQGMCNGLPVWVKPLALETDTPELAEALQLGAAGFWVDERIFSTGSPAAVLQALRTLLHVPAVA